MTTKDKDNEPSATPFTDGLEGAIEDDPNEARKARLKEAIKTHAKANRKVVKARKAR